MRYPKRVSTFAPTPSRTFLTGPLLLAILVGSACNSTSPPAPTPSKPAQIAAPPTPSRTLPPADPREAKLAKQIAKLLSEQHLLHLRADDKLSLEAFPEFLERLDPSKSYLLSSNVTELQAYSTLMDDEILDGNLTLARLSAAILSERQQVIAQVVSRQLAKPFDFTINESIENDPDKIEFATDDTELADRWRRKLKQQALERVARMDKLRDSLTKSLAKAKTTEDKELTRKALAKIPTTDDERRKKAREDIAKSYDALFSRLAKPEPLEAAETFLNSITSVYDPHTVYLAPAERANFDIQMSGKLEGIGAVLQESDHYIKIVEIIAGGASERQGELKAGDLILAVAQRGEEPVDIIDMRINMVVSMIRGKAGSLVTLTVKKPDDRIQIIPITRDVVEVEASYARGAVIDRGPKQPRLGLIYLPSFYGSTRRQVGTNERNATDDVRELLKDMSGRKLGGLVIDLRGNGGGFLDQARDISGMFIDVGPIVQTRYASGNPEILIDRDPAVEFDGNVVVLVDRFSASASEIVAAALQDYERAVVVGTTTHGKGTVQVLLDLSRMAGGGPKPMGILKLTIQQFFRIKGGSTQFKGVIPDIALPDPAAHVESGERFLDHAIGWSEVEKLPFKPIGHPNWTITDLAKQSAIRVAANPIFDQFQTLSKLAKERRSRTVVPLNRQEWMARRAKDEAALEAADPKLSERKKQFEVRVVGKRAGRKNSRIEYWRKSNARDPWLGEAVNILNDMAKGPSRQANQ